MARAPTLFVIGFMCCFVISLMIGCQGDSNESKIEKTSDDATDTGKKDANGRSIAEVGQATLTLKGHTEQVMWVTFSPDGKRLASASSDSTVNVWDATSGQETLTLQEIASPVYCVAFSPDGKCLATAASGVKVWDTNTKPKPELVGFLGVKNRHTLISGQAMLELEGHGLMTNCVVFSPDGKRLATTGIGASDVKVWDATNGNKTLTLKGLAKSLTSVAFSPNGKLLVAGGFLGPGKPGALTVWDATSGQETLKLEGHTRGIYCVVFSPDGKRVASASFDGTVKVWDATSGEETLTVKEDEKYFQSVAFSPNGKQLAAGGGSSVRADDPGELKVWDATSGQVTLTLRGHTLAVNSVAFSPDGKRLAAASWDKTVRVWDVSP